MNISYNWLKDYLDFDLSPQATADTYIYWFGNRRVERNSNYQRWFGGFGYWRSTDLHPHPQL